MNRSGSASMPAALRRVLTDALTKATLMQMTCSATGFLLAHNYNPMYFPAALDEFEDACMAGDLFITEPIRRHLLSMRAGRGRGGRRTVDRGRIPAGVAGAARAARGGDGMQRGDAAADRSGVLA